MDSRVPFYKRIADPILSSPEPAIDGEYACSQGHPLLEVGVIPSVVDTCISDFPSCRFELVLTELGSLTRR